ncbi:hypothetical protein BCR44DRAFT_76528 [Catenaria anguillulae PL171]|uniref:Uncharacterized protein n=1 Tax=Catenaria anguillulae PL171 TaxID=765915 RepID=A0A1Y2HVI1_9FUNG|nr:hypothetical protein BCR44DRAFT_76528 [Catenaria anguillulae PL171]
MADEISQCNSTLIMSQLAPISPSPNASSGHIAVHGLTSSTSSHDDLVGLADSVLPTAQQRHFAQVAVQYVTDVVTKYQFSTGRVTRVAKAGSFFKGTAVNFNFDIDLVVQFIGVNLKLHMAELIYALYTCYIAELGQQLEASSNEVVISELSSRKYSVEVHLRHRDNPQLALKIDVLGTIDVLDGTQFVLPDGFITKAGRDIQVKALQAEFFYDDKYTMNPDRRRLYQPLVSEAAVFDMRNAHEDARRLVRLLKMWAWSSVCTRDMATALSSVMEQIALHVWCQGGGHLRLDQLFSSAIQQLCTITTMKVGESTRKAINNECPRLVHQCDPLNNLLNTADARVFSPGYQATIQSAALASTTHPDTPVQWLFKVPTNAPLRTCRLHAMLQVFPNAHCAAPMCNTNDLDAKPIQLHRLLAAFLTLSVRAHFSRFAAAFASGQMHESVLGCDLSGKKRGDLRMPLVNYSVDKAQLGADDPLPDVLEDVVKLLSSVYRFNYWKRALVELEMGVNAALTQVRIPLPFVSVGGAQCGDTRATPSMPSGVVVLYVYHFVSDPLSKFAHDDAND